MKWVMKHVIAVTEPLIYTYKAQFSYLVQVSSNLVGLRSNLVGLSSNLVGLSSNLVGQSSSLVQLSSNLVGRKCVFRVSLIFLGLVSLTFHSTFVYPAEFMIK